MSSGITTVWEFWDTLDRHQVFNGAAALAFYFMLALFPAAMVLLSILPYLPMAALSTAVMDLIHQALPSDAASVLSRALTEVLEHQGRGRILSLSFLFAWWSASNGLYAIIQQLNITEGNLENRPFWKVRATSLTLSALLLFLVIVAFALIVLGGMAQDWLAHSIGSHRWLLDAFCLLRWVIIMALCLLGFSFVYHFGPCHSRGFHWVTPGSLLGSLILVLASVLLRWYVSHFGDFTASYGSLGAAIVLLLWLYNMGLVLLIGYEFNSHLRRRRLFGQ